MGVRLEKGQGVSLEKSHHDLSQVTIGLGWDVNPNTGLLAKRGGASATDYDLDVIAFLCGADGKVKDLGWDKAGKATLVNSDVVHFNHMKHRSGCVWLTGDDRTGAGGGDGDDEQIIVRLNDLPAAFAKLVFVVQIYKGREHGQSFGEVRNAYIRATDARGQEMARFDLSGGAAYQDCRSLLFAELERNPGGGWTFRAIGTPSPSDNFVDWLKQFL
jgi:stress response protein SCP2